MSATALCSNLNNKVSVAEAELQQIAVRHSPATLANSLGVEDMVLTDMIARLDIGIAIFSLDTGRLPAQTYELLDRIQRRYQREVAVYFPRAAAVEGFVAEYGINAFYRSVERRKQCCGVRKVEPLGRALRGKKAWITGLRRAQAPSRHNVRGREWDEAHGLDKFNPLIDWTERDVWDYVRAYRVPYNALHDQGYPSIGCAPCTRATALGENIRAGRWWWEDPHSKECGLHRPQAAGGG